MWKKTRKRQEKVIEHDDVVDELFCKSREDIIHLIHKDPNLVNLLPICLW